MDWRKSTYSDANGGACVETASDTSLAAIVVRDTTKNRDGTTLSIQAAAWLRFIAALK
jgi:hypothetical protein